MAEGSGHIFSQIFIHLNWHCKEDRPLITPSIEPVLHEFLTSYCRVTKGVHFIASGGTEDHVHLLFQMEPFVRLSEFIGQIKGASSHQLNEQLGRQTMEWQRGYGAVGFAGRNLGGLTHYVQQQKEHHRTGSLRSALEAHDYTDNDSHLN